MKRNLSLWQLAGFAFTSIGGTLLHFLYDLTGQSVVAAPFSAVNESTWEHMKLLFFPMFVFALVQSRFFGERPDFWCVKLAGSAAGLALIPVLFYIQRRDRQIPRRGQHSDLFRGGSCIVHFGMRAFQKGKCEVPPAVSRFCAALPDRRAVRGVHLRAAVPAAA